MFVEPEPTPIDLRWRMFAIPVRVSPWFWLVSLLMGFRLPNELLPIWILCVFVGILVHELGHALTARAFGARGVRILLYAFGGLSINEGGLARRQRVIELLMGPGAGFILFGVLFLLRRGLPPEALPPLLQVALHFMELICLWWGLVNLLPVYPLDGGQIAKELLDARAYPRGAVHRLGIVAGGLVATGFFVWYASTEGQGGGLYPALLFAYLAFLNWQLLDQGGGWSEGPRDPWERDADWWR